MSSFFKVLLKLQNFPPFFIKCVINFTAALNYKCHYLKKFEQRKNKLFDLLETFGHLNPALVNSQ